MTHICDNCGQWSNAEATLKARVQELERELKDEHRAWHEMNERRATAEAKVEELERERDEAMRVLAPNMLESGLVDACRQVKQVAIAEADNSEKLEREVARLKEQADKVAADHVAACKAFADELDQRAETECNCNGGDQGEGLVALPHEPTCPRYQR